MTTSGYLLEAALEDYLSERRKLGYGCEKTLRWMHRRLLRFVRKRLDREPLAVEVLREDLDALLLEMAGYSPTTRFHTAVNIRLFYRWLFKKGILLIDPTADLEVRRPPRPLLLIPSREQIERLLSLATPEEALMREGLHPSRRENDEDLSHRERIVAEALRERAVLELLYGSGLRIAEARGLDVADLQLAERTLLLRQGKGKKDRVVPVTRAAALSLTRYLAQGREVLVSQRTSKAPWTAGRREKGALFVTISGARINLVWQNLSLKPLFRLAGLPDGCGPHRLRHACALHLLESGVSIVLIARLLGHESLISTTVYLRLSTAALRKALMLAHPLEKLARA